MDLNHAHAYSEEKHWVDPAVFTQGNFQGCHLAFAQIEY